MPSKKSGIESLSFNQVEFAELVGASKASVTGWKKQGLPVNADGSIPFRRALAWWIDRELASAGGEAGSEWLERWRKARAQREELALRRDKGELVSQADVAAFQHGRVIETTSALRSVGQALAPSLVGATVEVIAQRIDDRLRRVCNDFARGWATALKDSGDPEIDDVSDLEEEAQ